MDETEMSKVKTNSQKAITVMENGKKATKVMIHIATSMLVGLQYH